MKIKRMTRVLVLVSLMTLIGVIAIAQASSVEPVFYPENPTCEDLGYGSKYSFKIDDAPYSGTFNIPGGSITVTTTDNIYFNWTSTLGIDAVISKGGNGANVYFYDPESMGDTGLVSPDNASTGPAAISHIDFCYDYELEISKTAETSYTRTYDWTIKKSVTPEAIEMFVGDQADAQYTIAVDRTFEDSDWMVFGTVTVYNPAPDPVDVSYSDTLAGYGNVALDCPTTIAAGATVQCDYEVAVGDASTRVNTVWVTSTTDGINGGSATATATFGDPTTEVNDSIVVDDTNGDSFNFSAPGQETYIKTFACGESDTYDNTATIRGTDKSSSASVDVTCNVLEVSKTAETSFTRTWEWTIEKSVDPASWDLFKGDDATSTWTVTVDKTGYKDSDWAVSGTISVHNPAGIDATLNSVLDVLYDEFSSPMGSPDVSCGVSFPYVLASGGTLDCTYSFDLSGAYDGSNIATATLQNVHKDYLGNSKDDGTTDFSSDPVSFSFGDAVVTEVNDTITVTDPYLDEEWIFSDDGSESVDEQFFCDSDAGNHHNIATIKETKQWDDADVFVSCYDLTVTKTADTAFNRYWTWDIAKSADQTELTLSAGQLFQVNYDVSVYATFEDADFMVSGEIVISNPAPMDAKLTQVLDEMTGYSGVSVTCPSMTVPTGDFLTCTYSQEVTNANTLTNTATATLQNYSYDADLIASPAGTTDFSGSTAVVFSATPADEIDECIDVSDTNVGDLGTVCANEAPKTFSYSLWFGLNPEADVILACGENSHDNIASFVTNDTGATGEDTWTILANVACDYGCTLTPGYWKTHSSVGPAPYDDTWALKGEDTEFFLSGQTYYQVLWTNPTGGNAYYILAHAYIAAELNGLNGASMEDIQGTFDAATVLFNQYTPDQVAAMKGKEAKVTRALFIDLATILDDYNNGYIGPGHCTE